MLDEADCGEGSSDRVVMLTFVKISDCPKGVKVERMSSRYG